MEVATSHYAETDVIHFKVHSPALMQDSVLQRWPSDTMHCAVLHSCITQCCRDGCQSLCSAQSCTDVELNGAKQEDIIQQVLV